MSEQSQAITHDPSLTAANAAMGDHLSHPRSGDMGHVALELGAVPAEERDKPGYADLEASIAAMEHRFGIERDELDQAYDSSSDEEKQAIDAFERRYADAARAAVEKGEEEPTRASLLESADDVPDNYKTYTLACEATVSQLAAADRELEKYLPEKLADVTHMAADLEASLDYDKVVDAAFADDERRTEGERASSIDLLYKVSGVIGVRKLLEAGKPATYHQLRAIEADLSKYSKHWQPQGLLAEDSGEQDLVPAEPFTNEQLDAMEAQINDALAFRTKYKRHDESIQDKAGPVLHLINKMRNTGQLPADLDELYTLRPLVYNDKLSSAMHRRLTRKLAELPSDEFEADVHSEAYARLVEQARAIDPIEALQKLEIKANFENLPFAFSEEELKTFLSGKVPAIALASVKRLAFRPLEPGEDEEGDTNGFHAWSEGLGGTEIVISDSKIHEYYQEILTEFFGDNADEQAKELARQVAKNRMLDTLVHEYAHGLHTVLPYAALKRWEAQRAADPTNITAYVKSVHDENHYGRYKEDFADSMMQFGNLPEVLIVTSSTRFDAMRQIYEEYMPRYQDTLKQQQYQRILNDMSLRSAKGVSDEEVRRRHLSHETQ